MEIAIGIMVGYYPANIVASGGGGSVYFRPASTDLYRQPDGVSIYYRPVGA
jgi:hypothetical protein